MGRQSIVLSVIWCFSTVYLCVVLICKMLASTVSFQYRIRVDFKLIYV